MTAQPRVLVVSASDTVALRLRLLLEAEGAEVVVAPTLSEAAALAAESPPILAVLDQRERDEASARLPGVPLVAIEPLPDWEGVGRSLKTFLADPGSPPADEAEAMAEALRLGRILLLDDSATYRKYLRLEMERWGLRVEALSQPAEAFARLATGEYDAAVIDLVMPGEDGAQLCQRAARMRREKGLSFLLMVLSSRETRADLTRCLEAGADEFLGKSADMELLKTRLGAHLRRKRHMDALRIARKR